MSNETLDERRVRREVRRPRGPGARSPRAHRRRRRQRARRAKVGPKTAAKWLAQYGTLDEIVAHAGEIPGVVGENLRAALDWLPQGRRLLTVKTDCALPSRRRPRARRGGRRKG